MTLEDVAIWTGNLEKLKDFYVKYFGAVPNEKYTNTISKFQSYFLTFASGAGLELRTIPGIHDTLNDTIYDQHKGITHLAFGTDNLSGVDAMAIRLKSNGFQILRGPGKTGDGYSEFKTLDPDNNRLEVTCLYPASN